MRALFARFRTESLWIHRAPACDTVHARPVDSEHGPGVSAAEIWRIPWLLFRDDDRGKRGGGGSAADETSDCFRPDDCRVDAPGAAIGAAHADPCDRAAALRGGGTCRSVGFA